MIVPGAGRLQTGRARLVAAGVVVLVELAIALPFLVISPSDVRGVPGPLLIVVGVAASYVLGPWLGVGVTTTAVVLAVTILGENRYAEPLVWIPAAAALGVLGDRVRREDEIRRELLDELRRGLVSLERERHLGEVDVISRYIPAETAQVLAGDFYGVVAQSNGTVVVMVGDVAGHGPASAALATRLRAMWRGLAVAEVEDVRTVEALDETLRAEQERMGSGIPFATLCITSIMPGRRQACVMLAGHPPPLLVTASGEQVLAFPPGPPIGLTPTAAWTSNGVDLPAEGWSLLLYTDGLVEGRANPGGPRPFGRERLLPLVLSQQLPLDEQGLDALVAGVTRANGEPLGDDVIVVSISPPSGPVPDP